MGYFCTMWFLFVFLVLQLLKFPPGCSWQTHENQYKIFLLNNYMDFCELSHLQEILLILHSITFSKQKVTSIDSWSPFFSHLYDGLGFPLALQSQYRVSSTATSVSFIIWIQWGFAADEIHINNKDPNKLLFHMRIKGLICTALISFLHGLVCTNRGSRWFCFKSPNETNFSLLLLYIFITSSKPKENWDYRSLKLN